jgi:hypothetical protein
MRPSVSRNVLPLLAAATALLLFFSQPLTLPVHSAQVTLQWDPSPEPSLAGYKVYYGTSSRNYSVAIDVGKNSYGTIPFPDSGTVYYIAVTSYDLSGNESQFSEELSYAVAPRCDFSLSFTSQSFIASGGSGAVTVQTPPGCAWSAASPDPWLTITSGQSGSGSGRVWFSLSPNSSPAPRTASLNIGEASLLISQEGALPQGAFLLGINAGGSFYSNVGGIPYQADSYYRGGESRATDQTIRKTNDAPLYQTGRGGSFAYSIPVTNGTYQVTLKFAETTWTARGRRVFDVYVEGARVVRQLDLFAVAGRNTAHDLSFLVKVADGTLDLNFLPLIGDATVSAILVRSAPDSQKPQSQPLRLKKYSSGEARSTGK